MNYRWIAPHSGLIDEVLANLTGKGGDYSGNIVVFPGKRPSHFLRKAIGKRRESAFIPPLVAVYGRVHRLSLRDKAGDF
ncbi:MAG: hypothetical protein HQK98_01880 [Nitrospirae bacterium]|nr:hypothetical protein [Nitrospirota bacterium]